MTEKVEIRKMKIADMAATIKEALAVREALRRCGYSPNDLYVTIRPCAPVEGGVLVGIECRWGTRSMEFAIGWLAMSLEYSRTAWIEACGVWNDPETPEQDRQDLWCGSVVKRDSVRFVLTLSDASMLKQHAPFTKEPA